MALSCAQMCLQCGRLLVSRTTVCAWVSAHFGHCSSSTWTKTTARPLLNRSLILRGSLTTAQGKEKWRQGLICVSNLTAKHLSERVKDSEELPIANVAANGSPLSPVTDAHPPDQSTMSLGVSYLYYSSESVLQIISMLTVRWLTRSLFILLLDHIADKSALEEITDNEAVSISLLPAMPPASTSLRDYVDNSETLSKLVQLGNQTLFFISNFIKIKNDISQSGFAAYSNAQMCNKYENVT